MRTLAPLVQWHPTPQVLPAKCSVTINTADVPRRLRSHQFLLSASGHTESVLSHVRENTSTCGFRSATHGGCACHCCKQCGRRAPTTIEGIRAPGRAWRAWEDHPKSCTSILVDCRRRFTPSAPPSGCRPAYPPPAPSSAAELMGSRWPSCMVGGWSYLGGALFPCFVKGSCREGTSVLNVPRFWSPPSMHLGNLVKGGWRGAAGCALSPAVPLCERRDALQCHWLTRPAPPCVSAHSSCLGLVNVLSPCGGRASPGQPSSRDRVCGDASNSQGVTVPSALHWAHLL